MESGINQVVNSPVLNKISSVIDNYAGKIRTGAALKFSAAAKATTAAMPAGFMQTLGEDKLSQVMIIIIGFLFFIILWWFFNKMDLDQKNCDKLDTIYTTFPLIKSIEPSNPNYKNHRLRDYYIKTAYNCCAGGNYKNDYVNLCALKNCIKQGARCLDFEIYAIDNFPVVAVSSVDHYTIKESYNSVPFAKAMEIISIYAFSGGNCPNPRDPLILNFRIKSNRKEIFNAMAKALSNTLGDRLLGKKFSYESTGKNIGSYLIEKLMGKIIIIVDKLNPLFTSTLLNEYVNIASNSAFVRLLRHRDVIYTQDKEELIFYNKQNMSIVLPELASNNKNFSAALVQTYGCQMIAMSFQNFDENMQYYTKFFDDAGSAFVLREEIYLYKPVFLPVPKAQNKCLTYQNKKTNPLGENGDPSLDMYVLPDCEKPDSGATAPTTDFCAPYTDKTSAKEVSLKCINQLLQKAGCDTTMVATKTPFVYALDIDSSQKFITENLTFADIKKNISQVTKNPKWCKKTPAGEKSPHRGKKK